VRKFDALFAAIGEFVVEWARTEHVLDLVVLMLCRRMRRLKAPHQLNRKTQWLRDCAEKQERLASIAEELTRLATDIDALSEQRHRYVHDALVDHTETARPLVVTLYGLLQPPDRPRRKPVKVTAKDIRDAIPSVKSIGDRALDLAEAVQKLWRL
jgi:hypothetical protein